MISSLEFLPLAIKKANLTGKGAARYRIETLDGKSMIVDADSAAEAMAKSGLKDARRIINVGLETQTVLEKEGLSLTDLTFNTPAGREEDARQAFFLAELPPDGVPEEFVAVNLGQLAEMLMTEPTSASELVPEIEPAVITKPFVEEVIVPTEVEVLPPEENSFVTKQETSSSSAMLSEKELTPEDVRRLLNKEE